MPTAEDRRRGFAFWATAVALMILAAVPRLYDLGNPGISRNEDYAVISARAIRDQGIPRFPSGIIYPRALLVSYVTAASTSILGENEIAARLPWAILSVLGVGLAYAFSRRVFGRDVALLVGLVLALSDWEIMTARTARMYAPLSLAFLLALYTMYKVAFENKGRFRIPNLVATILACSLHDLGAMLAVPYATVFLLGKPVHRRAFVALATAVVVLAVGAVMLFEREHYGEFNERVKAHHVSSDSVSAGKPGAPKLNALSPFGSGAVPKSRVAALLVLAGGLVVAIGIQSPRYSFFAALATTVVLVGMQQVALAFYAAAAFLGWLAFGRRRWNWYEVTVLGGVLAVGAVCWLAFLVAGPPGLSPVRAVRAIAGYPPNFLEFFARRSAAVFGVAVVGMLVVLTGFFRDRESFSPHVVDVSAFAVSATALGFHPSAVRLFDERYVFQLNPFYVFLFAAGAWWLARRAAEALVRGETRARQARALAMILALGLTLVSGGIAPLTTLAATVQHYGKNEGMKQPAGGVWFNPDHAGSSTFVCSEAGPDDFVVPMDILAHYVYCPRADIQLTLSDKGDAEGWIGVRSVNSLRAVGAELERGRAQQVWIVLAGQSVRDHRVEGDPRVSSVTAFTTWDCARRVYEGRDGLSDVWVMDRECFLGHAL